MADRLDNPSSTNRSASKRRPHPERPSGASEQASRINSASCSPSSLWSYSRSGLLRSMAPFKPLSQKRSRSDWTVPSATSRASAVRLSVQAGPSGPSSTFSKMRARVSSRAGRSPRPMRSRRYSRFSEVSSTRYFLAGMASGEICHETDSPKLTTPDLKNHT